MELIEKIHGKIMVHRVANSGVSPKNVYVNRKTYYDILAIPFSIHKGVIEHPMPEIGKRFKIFGKPVLIDDFLDNNETVYVK